MSRSRLTAISATTRLITLSMPMLKHSTSVPSSHRSGVGAKNRSGSRATPIFVRYVILLYRIRDGYLTLVDVFRTVISAGRLEELLIEVGSRFSATRLHRPLEGRRITSMKSCCLRWASSGARDASPYIAIWTEQLEELLTQQTAAEFRSILANHTNRDNSVCSTASSIGTGSIGGSSAPRSKPRSCRVSSSSSPCSKRIHRSAVSSVRRKNCTKASPVLPIPEAECCHPLTNSSSPVRSWV